MQAKSTPKALPERPAGSVLRIGLRLRRRLDLPERSLETWGDRRMKKSALTRRNTSRRSSAYVIETCL